MELIRVFLVVSAFLLISLILKICFTSSQGQMEQLALMGTEKLMELSPFSTPRFLAW